MNILNVNIFRNKPLSQIYFVTTGIHQFLKFCKDAVYDICYVLPLPLESSSTLQVNVFKAWVIYLI